jgi:hypothetical protein
MGFFMPSLKSRMQVANFSELGQDSRLSFKKVVFGVLRPGLLLVFLLCFPGTALAGEFSFGPAEGIVYSVPTLEPDHQGLTQEQIAKFEQNRERALHDAVWFLHHARWVMGGVLWVERGVDLVGRASGLLIKPAPPDETLTALLTRKIEGMAVALDAFLVAHEPLVAEMNQWSLQFSLGGMYGLAGYRYGDGKGVWLTLHVAGNWESGERAVKVTLDREALECAIPAIASTGVAVKVVYALGFESSEPDEGQAFYPTMLPLTQVTRRTLGFGFSKGLFLPPAPYLVYLQNTLRRSPPLITIRSPIRSAQVLAGRCVDGLLSIVRRK